jgi:hypothetical protein
MKAAVELLAEATDVIGSQSRQEVAGIKHNRYAFAWATPRATQDLPFFALRRQRPPSQQTRSKSPADDENVT